MGRTSQVFLAGGIVRRFPAFLAQSGFRERFVRHLEVGRYLQRIGTALVVAPDPGLLGAFHLLMTIESATESRSSRVVVGAMTVPTRCEVGTGP
jgi:hypothetical protein